MVESQVMVTQMKIGTKASFFLLLLFSFANLDLRFRPPREEAANERACSGVTGIPDRTGASASSGPVGTPPSPRQRRTCSVPDVR